jgi:peptidoglycan/LPS O-acetylase OafA/YrhL
MRKYYGIEFLRFLTSVSILLYHYRHFFGPVNILNLKNYSEIESDLPFYSFFNFFYTHGFYGVPVFYAISGFVFSYVYLSKKQDTTAKVFFINRFARLYPLHFATLILVSFLQYISLFNFDLFQLKMINDLYHFILQIFFISAWGLQDGHSFNGPIWSVSIEIGIYIIFFLLIKKIKFFKSFFIIAIIVLLTLIDKLKIGSSGVLFLDCARLFFSGILVYYLCDNNKINKFILNLISILLVVLSFVNNFKIFLFCPALLMFVVTIEPLIKTNTIKSFFKSFGNLTYSLYLIHVPVQITIILLFSFFELSVTILLSKIFFILYFLITFLIAYCSFKFYEFPLNNLLREKLINK